MNVGWRQRNKQDATNLTFIVKLLSQHVSGIIMPIFRKTRLCTTAYGVLHWLSWLWLCGAGTRAVCIEWESNSNLHTVHTVYDPTPHNHGQHNQCRTPYAAVHSLVLLKMGIMMPETCWDRSLTINITLIASYWFISLHPIISIVNPTTCTDISNLFYFGMNSTCFERSFRPSSGVQDCTYSNRHLSNSSICLTNACCCMYSLELLIIEGKTVRNM